MLPVGGTDWQSFVYLHANDLSYYDVIIQAHELRATKDYREYIFVSERMCVHIQSIVFIFSLSMLVFCGVLVTNLWVHGIMKPE